MPYETVKYGPYVGYDGVRNRSDVSRQHLASGSLNLRLDPVEQCFVQRQGSAVQGDNDPGSIVGLLASKWGALGRAIVEFDSQSNADGLPTYGVPFTDETDKEGVFYFRSTNGADYNHELGDTYDATNHYPAASRDLSTFEHKWLPIWSEGAVAQGRGVSAAQRKMVCPGTRRPLRAGRYTIFPNLQGTPFVNYGSRYNDTTSAGTEPERFRNYGHWPPMWFPRFLSSNISGVATTTPRPWKEYDQFYMAMTFVYEDGSESKPIVPQETLASFASTGRYTTEYINDFGLVTVPSTSGSVDYFPYLLLTQIPRGPAGVVERRLYRSPKVDSSIAGNTPDISDMRLWEVIPNNTTTTFYSSNGHDDGLVILADDPDNNRSGTAVLFGKVWPKRGRYMGTFDGRTLIGYLKDRPEAILICPGGPGDGSASTNSKLNNGTDEALITAGHFMYRVYDNAGTKTLALRFILAATAVPAAAPDGETLITLTSAKTLQDVCNEVNVTLCTTVNGGGEWFACVAPGTDPNTTADNIDYTSSYAYGDDALLSDGTTGNVRCWNNAWPAAIYFTQSYMESLPTYKNKFIHTEAGPLFVNIGQSGSAFNWIVNGPGWMRSPPEDAGQFVGMAPLPSGCVLFYARSVWRYENRRGGTTGEDFDYRANKISDRGCIAWDTIRHGAGLVFWLSADGWCASDGTQDGEVILSGGLYDPRTGTGDLAYEIGKCIEATGADTDAARVSAAVIGNAAYLSFRASGSYPNRTVEFPLSGGAAASGLSQVMDPLTRQVYGHSTPWTIGYLTMGTVRKSGSGPAALWKLGVVYEDTSAYSTGDGRVDRFDTGLNDPGSADVVPTFYHRMDDFEALGRRVRARRFRVKHRTGSGGSTVVGISRDISRASRLTYTLADTGSDPFGFGVKRIKLANQSASRVYEMDGTSSGALTLFKLFGAEIEIRRINTPLT